MSTTMEMPKYQSHKKVWALKIKNIIGDMGGGAIIYPEEEGYGVIKVESDYVEKHAPFEGGYYVEYEGGYKSFSPADVFESGYTLL